MEDRQLKSILIVCVVALGALNSFYILSFVSLLTFKKKWLDLRQSCIHLEMDLYVSLRAELRSVEIIPSTQGTMPKETDALKSSLNLFLKRKSSNTFFFFYSELSLKVYLIIRWEVGKNYYFFPMTLVSFEVQLWDKSHQYQRIHKPIQ